MSGSTDTRHDGNQELRQQVRGVLQKAVTHLAATQAPRGSWPSDYGGPMFLLPMYVALAYAAGRLPRGSTREEVLRYFFNVQLPDGSFGLHAEAHRGSMFTSVLGYVALRMLGLPADDARLARLLAWIHGNGGAQGAASWGKFTLCLLGLYDWRGIHPLLPELWLLPRGLLVHPWRLWCHARMVYLPMAWLYGKKATVPLDDLLRALRVELYQGRYDTLDWPSLRDVVAQADDYRPATAMLKAVNDAQATFESLGLRSLREAALDECLHHIRFEDEVTHDIDIGPVNAVLNRFVHLFRGEEGKQDLERGWDTLLESYLWQGHDGLKFQGYNGSELWDLTFTLQAVLATPFALDARPLLERGYRFLRDNQILDDVPSPELHYRHRSRGGWPFSTRAHGWPITDCTAEGLKCALALENEFDHPIPPGLLRDAVSLLLSWQNEDGGWATYELQRAPTWLEALNPSQVFGDIMVDTSYVECTSAVLQALVAARRRFKGEFELDEAIRRGQAFLRGVQRADGSFEGSWAVCFTYGTWFGVTGLLATGVAVDDPAVRRACDFLLARQRPDGSWAEDVDTPRERRWLEGPTGHVAQTSWALSTLVRARHPDGQAMERAVRFLASRQQDDGSWAREAMVGLFNKTCLITYDNYRNLFPVWALGEWERRQNR